MGKSYSKIRHIQESNRTLENRFLNESTLSINTSNIYEQSMGGMSSPQTFAQASTDSAKSLTSITFPQFIEGLREFLSSGTGFVVQLLLEMFPGIGQFINVGAWSVLTVYDVDLGVNQNKWNWFNIIIDICAVATTGLGAKYVKQALSPIFKYASQSIEVFVASISKYTPKTFPYILKLVKSIKSFVGKMAENIKTLMGYFGKQFKNGVIYKGLAQMSNTLSKSVSSILDKVEKLFIMEEGKLASALNKTAKTTKHVGQHAAQHYSTHQVGHGLATAATGVAH